MKVGGKETVLVQIFKICGSFGREKSTYLEELPFFSSNVLLLVLLLCFVFI